MTEQLVPPGAPSAAGDSPEGPDTAAAGAAAHAAAVAEGAKARAGRSGAATLLEIEHLKTYFPILGGIFRRKVGEVYAVDDVSLEVHMGETLGLVGESGCGKTTLGRSVLRLTEPTAGRVVFDGIDVASLKGNSLKRMRRRMQIVFQDPMSSLNPRMPISDIIGEGLLAQADKQNGWEKRDIRDKRVGDSLESVGLRREYSRRYPHEFSGGQRQRIGIARALALQPDFIVCDEPVSALDVSIQSQVLNLLLDLREQFGLTYLFIAHNLSVVEYISDRVGVMYLGKIVELADVETLYRDARHPYTIALLSAIPDPDPRARKKRLVLKGDVPSPAAPPSGCRFHTRCWLREQLGNPENCATEDPPFREFTPGHRVACHWAEQVSARTIATAAALTPAVVTADVFEDEAELPPVTPMPGPTDALGPDSPQGPMGG
jgi:peptide/nickel transport system ATP-binding protein